MVVVFGAIIKLLKVESLSTYLLNLLLELFYREAQKCLKDGWVSCAMSSLSGLMIDFMSSSSYVFILFALVDFIYPLFSMMMPFVMNGNISWKVTH